MCNKRYFYNGNTQSSNNTYIYRTYMCIYMTWADTSHISTSHAENDKHSEIYYRDGCTVMVAVHPLLLWITVFSMHLAALVCWLEYISTPGIWNCNKIRTSIRHDLNMKWLDYWFWLFGSPAPRWYCGGAITSWHLALCLPLLSPLIASESQPIHPAGAHCHQFYAISEKWWIQLIKNATVVALCWCR